MSGIISFFDGGTFTGFFGIMTLLLIAYIFSTDRRNINLRIVGSALILQFILALFMLKISVGRAFIQGAADGITQLLGYSEDGIAMVFGQLGGSEFGLIFAIHILPVIIFFSALTSALYYMGVMQVVVRVVGRGISAILGTKPIESLNAAANVFVGQTEAPLLVRPYLVNLTEAQIFAIMVSGMASVSGTILAAYALLGVNTEYLLAAAFMTAPGGLLMAKLMMPDSPADAGSSDEKLFAVEAGDKPQNIFMAIANGTEDGIKMAISIGGMLIAFVSLIALVNGLLGGLGGWIGMDGLSVQQVLGWIFAPLMSLLGVHSSEIQTAGAMIGEKVILNEFVAFLSFGAIQETLSPKTAIIVTFALCGFANFASIAVQIGALGNLMPDRTADIAKLGVRAVAAGTLSNLMSGAMAGIIFSL